MSFCIEQEFGRLFINDLADKVVSGDDLDSWRAFWKAIIDGIAIAQL